MAKVTLKFILTDESEKKVKGVHHTYYTYKAAGEKFTFRTGKAAWTLETVKGHTNIMVPLMKAFDKANGLYDTPKELIVNFKVG